MRQDLQSSLKVITVWLLVGVGVFLAVQWRLIEQKRSRFYVDGETLEIQRAGDGHYHWPGTINDHEVDFLIDTGATVTAMAASLSRRLQLSSEGQVVSSTAGGVSKGERVRANIKLRGGVTVDRLVITALPGLDHSEAQVLLGMDVLSRLRWSQRDGLLQIDLRQKP
jgi:aspartyl protease family protein